MVKKGCFVPKLGQEGKKADDLARLDHGQDAGENMRVLAATGLVTMMVAMTGCATSVYAPGLRAGFVMDPDYEVTDKDIRNAFKARPQLRGPLRVAFYSF